MTAPLVAFARPVETNPLHPDEPCHALCELNLQAPDYGAPHRYQLVCVVRGDAKRWVRIDMGLSADWDATEFRVVADGDGDSVASVQAQADRIRDDMYWRKFLREEQEASTLIPDLINWTEESIKRKRRVSTMGFNYTRQRN